VVITARNEAGLENTRVELTSLGAGKVVTVAADVSSDEDISRSAGVALDACGGVDILVNNAYYSSRLAGRRPGPELTLGQSGAERPRAIPVHTAARAFHAGPRKRFDHQRALHRCGGVLRGPDGVCRVQESVGDNHPLPVRRACADDPGERDIAGRNLARRRADVLHPARSLSLSPLQRVGSADETASVPMFLAFQASSFITGQIVVADGGVLTRAFGPTPRYSRADRGAEFRSPERCSALWVATA
jgi:NAD(P)-dependent dehydrogenase (short-subunit alcohol dehydrogenase family)